MRQLGFSSVHFPESILDIEQNDFSNDVTVSWRFETLDVLFPCSKFILTIRDEKTWLDSCFRWHGHRTGKLMPEGASVGFEALLSIYGQTDFDSDVWLARREMFHKRVFSHFSSRPRDLLVLDICGGDGWSTLLPFVAGCLPFPKENVYSVNKEGSND